jgi:CIC family chloride channel protein
MPKPYIERIPEKVRLVILTVIYAVVGGLITVAFMVGINRLYLAIWPKLAACHPLTFLGGSFLALSVSSLLVGILMSKVSPGAAGSGIPQLKSAYWINFGHIPFRAILVKFIGGIISLGGGSSLGREGPTVFITGGLAANIASWLGIGRQQRRQAAATGAAAGLAAAFNTPLAAISFVLEEILSDLGNRVIGGVTMAAVVGAFIVHALIGRQPSFYMPSVDAVSWNVYTVVPLVALLAGLLGVAFQRLTLHLRQRMRDQRRIPLWLRPLCGALAVWVIGCSVFFMTGRLGVFGLGYEDLSDALQHGIGWKLALLLAVAKLAATIISYGSGGCGGIFSPTLFIGAMGGFFVAGLTNIWLPLAPADHFVLAAVGMSACFGAVVRAPVTSILMIFEMTHQFGMVPALMLGTLISQIVGRLAGRQNFYEAILTQDGHELRKIIPPRNLADWRAMPLSVFASLQPTAITDLSPEQLRAVLKSHPYRRFPVIIDGKVEGIATRENLKKCLEYGGAPELSPPLIFNARQTLQEVEPAFGQSNTGLFLVAEKEGGPVSGVFTLYDILRIQTAMLE